MNGNLDDVLRGLVDAGSFAWFSYGMMCMTNAIYYVDDFYWRFIIRDDVNILAFRTWWGTSEFIRVIGNFALWTIGLGFWALTFIPHHFTQELFAIAATFVMFGNMIRLMVILFIKLLSFAIDNYELEYKYYPYMIMWGGETTKLSIDYSLEISSFIGQLVAYPLLIHSIKQLRRYREGNLLIGEKLKQEPKEVVEDSSEADGIF